MQAAQTALRTAIKANDTAGISAQAATIGNLTAQQVQARATAQAAFYALLTSSQQTAYDEMNRGGFGMGGPGPGMGPGMGPGRGPGPGPGAGSGSSFRR